MILILIFYLKIFQQPCLYDGEDALSDCVLLLARVEALHVEGDQHEHRHPQQQHVTRLPTLRLKGGGDSIDFFLARVADLIDRVILISMYEHTELYDHSFM